MTHLEHELNRLKTVEVVKRQGEVLSTPEVTTYAYTAAGSRASVTLPSGIQTLYTYDSLNRLTEIKHVNSADALLGSFAYQHAPNNLRTGLTCLGHGDCKGGIKRLVQSSSGVSCTSTSRSPRKPRPSFNPSYTSRRKT